MAVPPPILTTKHMTWNKERRTLVMEASDDPLTHNGATARGYVVASHHTGRNLLFEYYRAVRDGTPDDELVAWVYRNAETGIELHILND